ncbi:hypothetical protein RI367_008648 [Sorochytrium milnesiophthora]
MTIPEVARIFHKQPNTIRNWLEAWHAEGTLDRRQSSNARKISHDKREWIRNFFIASPMSYLREAGQAYEEHFAERISPSSIWRILSSYGMKRKIREDAVLRYALELNNLKWMMVPLVFIDEVSFDNRDMWRTRGYGEVGKPVIAIVFGQMKSRMIQDNPDGGAGLTAKTLPFAVMRVVKQFRDLDMARLFDKCGYGKAGLFELKAYRGLLIKDFCN